MANLAYKPAQTQTPYVGGELRPGYAGMQADAVLVGYDMDMGHVDEQPAGPAAEPVQMAAWPERVAFKAHYAEWLEDSLFDSFPDRMRRHASYRAIVDQRERVVPLIAAELRRSPSFIFLALEDITGENPVPEEAEGNLHATAAAWLSWLRK